MTHVFVVAQKSGWVVTFLGRGCLSMSFPCVPPSENPGFSPVLARQ